MAEAKTKPTSDSVSNFLATIADPEKQKDCLYLSELMQRITGCPPVMWGSSIVGFDSYSYKLANGKMGESALVGFAPRKGDITIYIVPGFEAYQTLLSGLGKHKTAKVCLYVKRLADIDLKVLDQLITNAVEEMKRRYPN